MPATDDPLRFSEIVGALLLLALAAYLIAVFARRRVISSGQPMFVCAVRRRHQQTWRTSYARYDDDGVPVYSMGGLGVRPLIVLPRSDDSAVPFEPERRPMVPLVHDPVFVELPVAGERIELALSRDSYTALRSWWESAPPRRPQHRT